MKLKQLLIGTASIAALAVVPMSIVSCGNNNNNAVEELPSTPGTGDNNNSTPSTPGTGDNNNSTPSTPGTGDNNNQVPTINYIDVKNKDDIVAYILKDPYIVSEFIKQQSQPSFNKKVTSVKWTEKLKSIVYDNNGVSVTEKDGYFFYDITRLTFNCEAGYPPVLYYSYEENGKTVTHTISTNKSATISVDLHFRSTTKFTVTGN